MSATASAFDSLLFLNSAHYIFNKLDHHVSLYLGFLLHFTTVRLNVEENQLVNVFGEFCVCVGGLKSA